MKNFAWVGLSIGALALSGAAQAASFDCAKAQTQVEKMVCGDAELSKLDDELSTRYKEVLQDVARAKIIKRDQKQWLKARNACADAPCVKDTYVRRIRAMAQSTQNAQGIEALYGKWEAGGRAGIAIYGMMEISKSKITWKGSSPNPRCTVSYEVLPEEEAVKFKVNPERFQHLAPFKSYVLAIHGACSLHARHIRLTLPDNIPDYLDMNEYIHGSDDTGGYSHFYKR